MERFFDNDPDNEKNFYDSLNDDDDDDMDEMSYIDHEGVMQVMNIQLAQSELKHFLVGKAIKICEASFFWRFKSIDSKMKDIQTVYEWLQLITEED